MEVADVGWGDVTRTSNWAGTHGDYHEYEKTPVLRTALWVILKQSFGIAQISPYTAIRHNAVYVPEKNI